MYEIVVAVVAVAAIGVSYLERKALKAAAVADCQKLIELLRSKESQVRAKIAADVAKVIAHQKAEIEKLETVDKADLRGIVGDIEASIRKVI